MRPAVERDPRRFLRPRDTGLRAWVRASAASRATTSCQIGRRPQACPSGEKLRLTRAKKSSSRDAYRTPFGVSGVKSIGSMLHPDRSSPYTGNTSSPTLTSFVLTAATRFCPIPASFLASQLNEQNACQTLFASLRTTHIEALTPICNLGSTDGGHFVTQCPFFAPILPTAWVARSEGALKRPWKKDSSRGTYRRRNGARTRRNGRERWI